MDSSGSAPLAPPTLRSATVYLANDRPGIVSAIHFNSAGIYFEQDEPILVTSWRDLGSLGAAVRMALDRFSFLERNLREAKRHAWPSYRLSGFDSIREFERTYLPLNIRAVNQAELFYDAWGQPRGEEEISLHVIVNKEADDEIGRKIVRIFDSCVRWVG